MSLKPQKVVVPAPEEWDFREVPKDFLPYVIFYEYHREVEWLRQKFTAWNRLPKEKAIRSIDYNHYPFAQLRAISPSFPQPWLKARKAKIEVLRESCVSHVTCAPIQILREAKLSPDRLDEIEAPHAFLETFLVRINWSYSNERILMAVKDEIERARKASAYGEFKPSNSKGMGDPWARLRELAAFRLRNARLTFSDAQYEIRRRQAECRVEHYGTVLPNYRKSGGFSDAVTAARRNIEQLVHWFSFKSSEKSNTLLPTFLLSVRK